MNGHGNAKFGFVLVQESGATAGLVVNIKPGPQQSAYDLLRPENGQLIRHSCQRSLGEGNRNVFCGRLQVLRNGLAGS